MVADRNRKQSQTAMQYAQRFNVALSRARDRMVLVRSVTEEDLNPNDLKARIRLLVFLPAHQLGRYIIGGAHDFF
jgi:hypothetical protein